MIYKNRFKSANYFLISSILYFISSINSSAAAPIVNPIYFTPNDQIAITFDVTGTPLANQTNAYAWVWIPGNTVINSKYNINPASDNTTLTGNAKLSKSVTLEGKTLFTLTFIPKTFFTQDISGATAFGILIKGNDWSNGQTSDNVVSFWDGSYKVRITNPVAKSIFVVNGEVLSISGSAPVISSYNLFVNNTLVVSTTVSTKDFNYNLVTSSINGLSTEVILKGTDGSAKDSVSFNYIIKTKSPVVSMPNGTKFGINYDPNNNTKAIVTLWAPLKSSAYVLGDFNDWQIIPSYQMNRDTISKSFWLEIDSLIPGKEYRFQFLVDETLYVADPFSDKVLAPEDDQISRTIYPELISFPSQALNPSWYFQRVSVLQTAQIPYNWTAINYTKPAKENLVVYKLLIRDFFDPNNRSYKNLTDTISYFKRLGVNAIELLPITQFNGLDSWGYNPSFMFSPEKVYGPKNELKKFIDECHKNGIAVILDMVLNHQDLPNPYALMYFDFTNTKPAINNPFFNVVATHPYNVFYDMNHESIYTQKYIDTVNYYWLKEYKFDGYRFDLTKGFTQKNSGSDVNAWSAYDASRVAILKRMVDKIWSHTPDAYLTFEHLGGNQEETELSQYKAAEGKGIMLWNKMTDSYNQNTMGYGSNSDISGGYFKNKGWAYPRAMSYMESHDEERLMYKNLTFGNGATVKNLDNALKRMEAANLLFYSIPGPKMLWQFGEVGFDLSINRCTDGTISTDCRTAAKPNFWSQFANDSRKNLFNVTADLIKLRKENSLFTTGNAIFYGNNSLSKSITLINSTIGGMNAVVSANFDITTQNITLNFPNKGTWYEYYSDSIINVTNDNGTLSQSFLPGTYALYTDVKLEKTLVLTGLEDKEVLGNEKSSVIYPNPSSEGKISISGIGIQSIELNSITGRAYKFILTYSNEMDVSNLPSGLYLAKIVKTNSIEFQKVVLK